MNLDELKTAWTEYDQKLSVSNRINEEILSGMIRDRSVSRVSRIRRSNFMLLIWMFLVLAFIIAIIFGNPFDFKYSWQFIPYLVIGLSVFAAIGSILVTLRRFDVNLSASNLSGFLVKIIAGYEKNKQMERWFGIILFSAGAMTVFSFLPKKLENKPLLPALGETALMLLITLLIYFFAFKSGAFRNKAKQGFETDLFELNQLQKLKQEFE
jgi:multisubunit Na+/H+ antiporter MnhB subunit